ncbi:hypothetical protein [Azospirillum sp.]|uniref:hypothetical protein n=1 Tax=Azospirillum sp. TaxID=34012 RepID=UPI003D7034C4
MQGPAGTHAGPWDDVRHAAATSGQRQLRERLARLQRRSAYLGMAATWLVFLMIGLAVAFEAIVPVDWLWIPIGLSQGLKLFWHGAYRLWPRSRAKAPDRALAAARREIGGRLQPVADAINADLRRRTQRQGRVSVRSVEAVEFLGELMRAAQGFPFTLRPRSWRPAAPAVAAFAHGAGADAIVVALVVALVGVTVPLLTGSITILVFCAVAADLLSAVWLAERRLAAIAALVEWRLDEP